MGLYDKECPMRCVSDTNRNVQCGIELKSISDMLMVRRQKCNVIDIWSEWRDGKCNAIIGVGKRERTRKCRRPTPNGYCQGGSRSTVECRASK